MQLFANNADSELDGAITSVSTSITLKTGGGAKFPTPTGGDFFLVTLFQKVGITELNHEIVKCTARSGDVLTVVRAQEGTTGFAFSNADLVELRFTKGSAENLVQDADLSAHVGSGGAAHANVVAAGAAGFMTGADKTKLDGVATGATANTGTVTTASVITGNGFAGTVANPTTAPAITLTTSVTGIIKGNGTALSAAAASDITGQVLTGYVSGAGIVAATDTILQAVNKLNGNDALKQTLAAKDATGGYAGLTLFNINFKNVANTFTSFFTNSNTAARTYTFPDRDGTIADNTDLATKQATLVSATNIKTINGNSVLGSGDLVVGALVVVQVSGTTQTAVAGNHYVLTNVAATTVTLPASPASGDQVWVTWTNALATNVIARNAQTIMGVAEDMTLDASTNGTVQLRFVSSSWRIL